MVKAFCIFFILLVAVLFITKDDPTGYVNGMPYRLEDNCVEGYFMGKMYICKERKVDTIWIDNNKPKQH
jgi:hypothetical protein